MKRPRLITRRRAPGARRPGKWGWLSGKWGWLSGKWALALGCFLIFAAMVASNWYRILYTLPAEGNGLATTIGILQGEVYVCQSPDLVCCAGSEPRGWRAINVPESRQSGWTPAYWWSPEFVWEAAGPLAYRKLAIPLWIPLLLTALPTAFLFYRDRRPKPGYCTNCRYNLAGLKDNRCPECGTNIPHSS